ncbi:MAG: hypothetical protein NTU85_02620 [Candidatus Kaiserbacteria bacterium]|nr:hypothetical protein [Candidatus Kaiserbacteria bacterium]
MGHLSVLLVRHDGLSDIEKDAELGAKIGDAIRMYPHTDDHIIASGHFTNAIEVVLSGIHENDIGIVIVEGNTAYRVERNPQKKFSLPIWSKAEEHLVKLVRRLGYEVTRRTKS